MKNQCFLRTENEIQKVIREKAAKKLLLVCGSSYDSLPLTNIITGLELPYVRFSGFSSNPRYEDIQNGVTCFQEAEADFILAVGGGSAMDTAKCIKFFSKSCVPLLAIPTTAGTGSESTSFAVMYKDGVKKSVDAEELLPDYVLLFPKLLKKLPIEHKKAAMMDAFCQAVESWWSVSAVEESISYSKKAIRMILDYRKSYLDNQEKAAGQILLAANFAGRAINITRTTAAHAMSYKLTSVYKLPHGYAVALCLPPVWKCMEKNMDSCMDKRGKSYVAEILKEIAEWIGYETIGDAVNFLKRDMLYSGWKAPDVLTEEELRLLCASVDMKRMGNTPIEINTFDIRQIYKEIFSENKEE